MSKDGEPWIETSDVVPIFPTLVWKIQLKTELHQAIDVKVLAAAEKTKGDNETRQVRFTTRTRIWLDRSKIKMTNLRGDPGKIRRGQRIEVKYTDHKRKRDAEWIKVEITTP